MPYDVDYRAYCRGGYWRCGRVCWRPVDVEILPADVPAVVIVEIVLLLGWLVLLAAVEDPQEANPRVLVKWLHDLSQEWVRS